MILFRFAWVIGILVVVGQFVTACFATAGKPFPEGGWPTLQFTRPAWLEQPSVVVDVIWHREPVRSAAVRDGACHIYMPDGGERDLYVAEDLVRACVATGTLRSSPTIPAGARRLYWHQVTGTAAVVARFRELFAAATWPLAGFYYHPRLDGPCHVVTSVQHVALGHEIKHCFDGHFHGDRSRWRPRPPTKGGANG